MNYAYSVIFDAYSVRFKTQKISRSGWERLSYGIRSVQNFLYSAVLCIDFLKGSSISVHVIRVVKLYKGFVLFVGRLFGGASGEEVEAA